MSDDLVTGTDSGGWSQGRPVYNKCSRKYVSGGIVWMGNEMPTLADIRKAEDIFGRTWQRLKFDVPTFFGEPDFYTRMRASDDPCYSNQTVKLG